MTEAANTGQAGTRQQRPAAPAASTKPADAPESSSSRRASGEKPGRRPRKRRPGTAASEDDQKVLIELTKAQVDEIVRTAGEGGLMSVLLSKLHDPQWRTSSLNPGELAHSAEMEDTRLSHSFIAGLLVLASLPLDGEYVGIVALARMLGMSPSTTHRYVTTLVAVGLVERNPSTRGYRLAGAVEAHRGR